jgi:hypothetical protein
MKLFKKRWEYEAIIFEVVEFVDRNGNKVSTFEECTIVMVHDRKFGLSYPESAKMFNKKVKVGDAYLETTTRYQLPRPK